MPPKRPDLILPSHIPNIELDILIGDGLDVEADSRDGGDVGVELELVKDCYTPFAISPGFAQVSRCRSEEGGETHWSFLRHLSRA